MGQKRNLVYLMLLLSLVCILFGGIRVYMSENSKGFYLVWNLFLAWIPFIITFKLNTARNKFSTSKLILFSILWLLFLPNAPYIITDLIHLRLRDNIPLWYDATIIFLFAFHGLLLGIVSSLLIHEVIEKYTSKFIGWIFLIGSFILAGYGIYLGRFLRWNSWDILLNPYSLVVESIQQLTNPTAIAVTILFSLLMLSSYLLFHQLIHLKTTRYDAEIN